MNDDFDNKFSLMFFIVIIFNVLVGCGGLYLLYLLIMALSKYING